jgi:acyl-CoA thioesterase I
VLRLGDCKYLLLLFTLSCARRETVADSVSVQASRTAPGIEHPASTTSQLSPRTSRTILFIGTSLTAGYGLDPDSAYPLQIQRMIDSAGLSYSVVNAGVSGETSSALLRRLDWLLRQPFDLVVIETGANDGLRGIPIETMQGNVEQIIEHMKQARPDARVALVQMEALPNLGIRYTQRFREVFPDVAKRTGATLIPFLLQDVAGRRDLNQADGIHPNYAGERIVARNVWKGLRPLLQ